MATNHIHHQQLHLGDPQKIQTRDLKLWCIDEARANVSSLQRYQGACPICPSARPLKRKTILKHFHAYGRHLRNPRWVEVCSC